MTTAGLLHGPLEHHLDHLAPLCALKNIPLVVTDEQMATLTKKFYPQVTLMQLHYNEMPFEVVARFDTIFSTLPYRTLEEIFFFPQKLLGKTLKTVWCPHGNSDKGHQAPLMEALSQEAHLCLYGKKMRDFLQLKGAFNAEQTIEYVGNFRKAFAEKHREFYAQLVDQTLPWLDPQKPTILYAPTWKDAENSSSLEAIMTYLQEQLPPHFNLIIKPHPNQPVEGPYVLNNFPPIYPLLDRVDIYLGDLSSIGYDFLAYNRPMFFLNPNSRDAKTDPGLFLFRCGTEISRQDYPNIYKIIEKNLDNDSRFAMIRQAMYHYTYVK